MRTSGSRRLQGADTSGTKTPVPAPTHTSVPARPSEAVPHRDHTPAPAAAQRTVTKSRKLPTCQSADEGADTGNRDSTQQRPRPQGGLSLSLQEACSSLRTWCPQLTAAGGGKVARVTTAPSVPSVSSRLLGHQHSHCIPAFRHCTRNPSRCHTL